mmetsp:Transcript_37195/g.45427  ORF Transcript_37195/g.45427 Transcript_37195/m.45427 type:complete len:93 (+) Transcript_37195:446-724(+)
MNSIKQSTSLQEFLDKAERLSDEVNDNLVDYIEEEHNTISEKLSQSKFAYLVIKSNYYSQVNEKFTAFNEATLEDVRRVKQLEDSIIDFKAE